MRVIRRGRRRGVIAVIGVAIAIAAWTHAGTDFVYRGETVAVAAPEADGDVASLLDQVTVVERVDEVPGYERSCKKDKGCVFGPAWNDPLDRSGCDTRQRILSRDLRDITYKDGTRNCKVIAGWLQDPYSGERVDLSDIEVDHLVALHYAWNAGAWQWDSRKREIFANDPIELRATSSSMNRSKSDAGLDEWLPPNPAARCPFVTQYLTVLIKYELPITVRGKDAAVRACAAWKRKPQSAGGLGGLVPRSPPVERRQKAPRITRLSSFGWVGTCR